MENLDSAKRVVEDLFAKYAQDPYMLEKTHNYICNQLPGILENIKTTHEQRVQRIEIMTNDQDRFIESFLTNNQYFYVPTTETYFFYDGNSYQISTEDGILHHVLSTISRNTNLMSWKQRTRIYVMKRIRDNHLFSTIPNSETIQSVLRMFYPTLFSSKTEVKYFLTVLGDNIKKKNNKVTHFIDIRAKSFLKELNQICQQLFGANLNQTFRYKYYDHDYQASRILRINEAVNDDDYWVSFLSKYALDILCVACHYSNRFGNSDEYAAEKSNDSELRDMVFALKETNPTDMVDKFIQAYIQISGRVASIQIAGVDSRVPHMTWKDVQYLWNKFLDANYLPAIMFQQTMKNLMIGRLGDYYRAETDSFLGITSEFLPNIQLFLQYWTDTIVADMTETDFEIEELAALYNKWLSDQDIPDGPPGGGKRLNDKQIVDIITHFFPHIEVGREKYISHIRSTLWDKHLDIQVALEELKDHIIRTNYVKYGGESGDSEAIETEFMAQTISIYDAYQFYCRFYGGQANKLIVNKTYFEKYVLENLADYVLDNTFITMDWVVSRNR
jgi:hypothetical protein